MQRQILGLCDLGRALTLIHLVWVNARIGRLFCSFFALFSLNSCIIIIALHVCSSSQQSAQSTSLIHSQVLPNHDDDGGGDQSVTFAPIVFLRLSSPLLELHLSLVTEIY